MNKAMTKGLAGFAGIVAILVSATGVLHADYCLSVPSDTTYVLVGRGFTPPLKGGCKAFVGFNSDDDDNAPTTGIACTSSAGTTLNFTLTTSFPEDAGHYIYFDTITLSLPSPLHSGTDEYTELEGSTIYTATFAIVGATCSGTKLPGVTTEGGAALSTPPHHWILGCGRAMIYRRAGGSLAKWKLPSDDSEIDEAVW
jgi:hypothetical protein